MAKTNTRIKKKIKKKKRAEEPWNGML